jgi:demethylmacrocin O-methyltransferase
MPWPKPIQEEMMKPTLMELGEKYHSDKLFWHSYLPKYEELFKDRKVETLLEVGIGYKDLMQPFLGSVEYVHGSSLHMWEEYFPDAQIFACDIHAGTLVNEGRITSIEADQSNVNDLLKLAYTCKRFPDVIIDDGSHIYEHQRITAEFFVPYMPVGTLYVIEDCWPENGNALVNEFGGEFWQGEKGRDDGLVIIRK